MYIYVLAYFITAVIAAAVAAYAWHRRATPGAVRLAWLTIAVAEWSFTNGLETAAVGIPAKVFWSKVSYLGITTAPILFCLFALEYSRPDRALPRFFRGGIWIVSVVMLLVTFTNEWHGLLWPSFTPSPAGHNILIYGHGIWFYAQVAYFYAVMTFGAVVLIRAALHSASIYRYQTLALVIGAVMPMITSVIYVTGLSPVVGLDITPLGVAFSGLALAWGALQFGLLDLAPVARDLFFGSMTDGAVVLDTQNRIVDINPAAQRLFGVTAAIIGQSAGVALAARPDLIERFRDVLEGQAEIVLGKTPPRHLDLRISPVRDRRGRFTGRLVILRDITERKLAEETLRQQQEADRHFSGQLAVLHEVSLELSLADSFDDLCRLAIELGRGRLGFDRIGIWFLDRDDPRYMVGTFGVDEQGRLRDERSQHLSLRPEWVWAELLGGGAPLIYRPTSEIYDDRGQTVGQGEMAAAAIWDGERVIGLVCIDNFLTGQPITERQQELLVLYARILGHLSTLKRTKGALQLSNAELQARNEELNAFAHTVAHDLKTPLNVILGYAELLTEGAGGSSADEIRLYAHAIRQGTHKATAIINSLLLLASARQQSVPVVPLDVGDLAAEACARLTQEIAGRRAEIVWPAAWLPALGYAPWIEEVWLNYLSNALKYGGRPELTPPVPPRIELSAQAGADGFIRFAVRDNGRGISAEDQKRLFVPFNRIGERREAGHGLGLSIVRRIVERLGGQVGVESVPGEGSSFYFTLPAVPGANGS